MNKKKITALLLIVLVLAIAATGATLAYFTDTGKATNTVTFGNVAIELDEAKVIKNGDQFVVDTAADRVDENTYTDAYPGAVLPKDPTVHNVGSYDAYVRVQVGVSMNVLAAFTGEGGNINTAREMMIVPGADWTFIGQSGSSYDGEQGFIMIYEYRYNAPLASGQSTTPFIQQLTVPTDWTNETVKTFLANNRFIVDITAEAVQTAGFADADAAWAAIDA